MPRSVDPRTWAKVADPILRQAFKELADRLEEVRTHPARGFLAYRAADLSLGAPTTGFVPMDGTDWNARPEGPSTPGEYYIPEQGSAAPACWRPTKVDVPWLVLAGVRANVAAGAYGQLELVDLNQTAPVLARLNEVPIPSSGLQLSGATLITPRQGQRISLRLDVGSWSGGSGVVSGGGGPGKPLRSYFGAFCLQP